MAEVDDEVRGGGGGGHQKHRFLTRFQFADPFSSTQFLSSKQRLSSEASSSDMEFYLMTSYDTSNETLELLLTDLSARLWFARTTIPKLKPDVLHIPHSEYCKNLLKALNVQDKTKLHFNYELKPANTDGIEGLEDGKLMFVVSFRPDQKYEIFVVGAEIVFEPKNFLEYSSRLFAILSRSLGHLRNENKRLKKQLNQSQEDRQEAIRVSDQAVVAKQDIENRLISAFVPILNTKKQRIRELLEEIEQLKNAKPEPKSVSNLSDTEEVPISPKQEGADDDDGDDFEMKPPAVPSMSGGGRADVFGQSTQDLMIQFNPVLPESDTKVKVRKRHRTRSSEDMQQSSTLPVPQNLIKRRNTRNEPEAKTEPSSSSSSKKAKKVEIIEEDDDIDDYEDLLKDL
jgi:hypothetical protein